MSKQGDSQIQATTDPKDNNPHNLKSKATIATSNPDCHSLRATVPEGIVAFLDLKAGDKLDWQMNFNEDGERVVFVRRIATNANQATTKAK